MAEQPCPVCRTAVAGDDGPADVTCPRCGLLVHSGYHLGPATPEWERTLDEQRGLHRRRMDAVAAVRAAGYPGPVDPVRLLRMGRMVDGPPLTDAELDRARALVVADAEAPTCDDLTEAAQLAAVDDQAEIPVVVVDEQSVSLRVFGPLGAGAPGPDDSGLVEFAPVATWSWPELLEDVPDDRDGRLFWLAGRVGRRPAEPTAVAAAAGRWADTVADTWTAAAVVRERPGWSVPDTFAATLVDRLPRRPVDAVLAPGRTANRWSASLPHRGSAWGCTSGALTPDRITLAIGRPDGDVLMWRIGMQPRPGVLATLRSTVTAVAPLMDGADVGVLAGSVLGEVVWVLTGGTPVPLPQHRQRVSAVAATVGTLLTLGGDGVLNRLRIGPGGANPSAPDVVELGVSGAATLAVADQAPVAVAGGLDGFLRVVDLDELTRNDIRLGSRITALALDPDGRVAAAAHGDGLVTATPLPGGPPRPLLRVANPPAGPLSLLLDGTVAHLVVADAAGLLTTWSGQLQHPRGGEQHTTVGRHVGGVGTVRYLPARRVFAVGRQDDTARLWSTQVRTGGL